MDQYRANGFVFDVTDAGPPDGEVVLLLHGFPETRASWNAVIPFLTDAGYRVLAPDQRGYSPGARPKSRRAYTLDHLVSDVIALVDEVKADRVHVVGHDWGGGVAWAMAGWHPDRVASMTSLTTPHPKAMVRSLVRSTQGLHSSYMVFFQLPWLPEMGITGPGRALFRRTLRRSGLSEAALDEYLRVLSQPGAATGAFNWYRALPFLPPSRVERTNVPVLYVYGTADFALGRKAADMTRDYVDGPFRYEILEGVSHWIPEAVPDVVGRLLLEHFASVHGRPGPRTGV